MKILLIFTITFLISYWLTDNSNSGSTLLREPSSEKPTDNRNSYVNIRCPSEDEFQFWAKELNMDPIKGPSLNEGCKTQTYRTQMAQLLALAKEIKINYPKDWAPKVQIELRNIFDYIKKNTNKLKIDLTQESSVARNAVLEKRIELGGLFFKEDPLSAISVLVHEARHSDSRDQGHTGCRIGDIPKTQGGCDGYFSNLAENAGAYAYGTLFELALSQYSPQPDEAEKELLLTSALSMLSTRFNSFSTALAKHFDILTVLLEDGTLAWINPYTFETVPLSVVLPQFQEKIKKIEFSPRTNSLIIYTESDRLFTWGSRQKATRPFNEAISDDDRFLHVSRQYIPFDSDRTLYTTLKTNGHLEYVKYDPQLNKSVILPYPLSDEKAKVPNLTQFFLGAGVNSYFLDKQGLITRARRYGNEENFILDKNIQSQFGGWKSGTGGVFYDDVILTDSDGKLNQVTISYQSNKNGTDDSENEVFSKKLYEYQSQYPARKYQQGLQFHALLDENGGILIANYKKPDKPVYFQNPGKKITDIVITRLTYADRSLLQENLENSELAKKCQINKVVQPIGYNAILGLTQNQKLVTAYSDRPCKIISPNKNWSKAELIGIDDASKDLMTKKQFPDVYLELSNQKERIIWLPYTEL